MRSFFIFKYDISQCLKGKLLKRSAFIKGIKPYYPNKRVIFKYSGRKDEINGWCECLGY
ncbi:hypothetical protein B4090_3489 [Bacillus licheniformis]|nr:hypothetical protein B4090_3489 [Bacillus licheniformis]